VIGAKIQGGADLLDLIDETVHFLQRHVIWLVAVTRPRAGRSSGIGIFVRPLAMRLGVACSPTGLHRDNSEHGCPSTAPLYGLRKASAFATNSSWYWKIPPWPASR
jgi:hypothetical protein